MAPTRPVRSLDEGNRSLTGQNASQRVKPVAPLTRAEAAGKRVFVSNLDGQDRRVDASLKKEISEKIVLNSVQETLETILVNFEFGGTREDILTALRPLMVVMDELERSELWEVLGALCKMVKKDRFEDDVRTEALQFMRVVYGRIALREEKMLDAVAKSQGLPAVNRAAMAKEHVEPDTVEQEMADTFRELINCDNPVVANASREIVPQIDSPLLLELHNELVFLAVLTKKITAELASSQSKAEFVASTQELEKLAPKLGLDALWKIMDALCKLAEQSETPVKVREYAFNSMPPLYKKIAAKIAQENVQEMCFSEARMAKIIVNTSLGAEGEHWALIEAATQAMDNIPSPVVQKMLLNCGFIGETTDRNEMLHQIEELDTEDKLKDSAMDIELAMFLYAKKD